MSHQPKLIKEEQATYNVESAEKAAYWERLRQKLQESGFRQIEGFPIGEDEAILELSDPPYYTACPNPFLPEIIAQFQQERKITRQNLSLPEDNGHNTYHKQPFTTDVKEGKYHPFYRLHPYPTKVPHRAIMRYILHYTEPGDIVLDGFCGTGMTGVAGQFCSNWSEIEELGYTVHEDGSITDTEGKFISYLGARPTILIDLSTAATFIAYCINTPITTDIFTRNANKVLNQVWSECGWMYQTLHQPKAEQIEQAVHHLKNGGSNDWRKIPGLVFGKINYMAWSDVFVCSECANELVYWETAVDIDAGKVNSEFACSLCQTKLDKSDLERAWITHYDSALNQTVKQIKRVPVLINYSVGRKRFTKAPDEFDLSLIEQIESETISDWFPTYRMPDGDESRRNDDIGITHIHQFYSKRNLKTLASFLDHGKGSNFLFAVTKVAHQITHMYRFTHQSGTWGAGGGPLSGTLYVPSLIKELSIYKQLQSAIKQQIKARGVKRPTKFSISTQSASALSSITDDSIDYIFIDPPFGSNLMYSELNFLWEAWLKVRTNQKPEAIENNTQGKGISEYQSLMFDCFQEFYRVLKPGRWMTLEFHNSKNQVWIAIQEAVQRAGFVVADVRTLDKKKKTFKQVTASGAVNQDLIISVYKPTRKLHQQFQLTAGTIEGVWEFLRQHLAQLKPVIQGNGTLEIQSERQDYLLFDRMVAFHIQRGASVPLSAAEFYAGLRERFVERDGMFFLPDQVAEYDKARLEAQEVAQLSLFVNDEKSAIQWLRQQLSPEFGGQPQTYQEIQPKFLQQLHQARHEALPELTEMLEQNFLQDEADRWYVPDPNKATDLEKLRQKALLREFQTYTKGKKKLKQFRTEAVRAGFANAWHNKQYANIVNVAERLPERVLQEDPDLLMYYDNASLRT